MHFACHLSPLFLSVDGAINNNCDSCCLRFVNHSDSRITEAPVYVSITSRLRVVIDSLSSRCRVYPRQYSFLSPLHHLTITYCRTGVKQVIPQLFAFLLRNFRNSANRYNNFIFVNAATLIQQSLDIPSIYPRSNGTI